MGLLTGWQTIRLSGAPPAIALVVQIRPLRIRIQRVDRSADLAERELGVVGAGDATSVALDMALVMRTT